MQPALRRSERGLDWFTFFVADIQTGFGPFLAVYLTTQKWNQADIGLILAIGSLAGLISQLPAGWLVDMAASKRRLAMLAIVGIGLSAFLIALMPSFLGILIAKLLHVASSSVLGPAIAAITLGLVGHAAVGPRLGRNARFASIGNGLAAGVMGATGYLISPQAVFLVTAVLALPTLLALAQISQSDIDSVLADGGIVAREPRAGPRARLDRPALAQALPAGLDLRPFPIPCRQRCHAAAGGNGNGHALGPLRAADLGPRDRHGPMGERACGGVHRRTTAHGGADRAGRGTARRALGPAPGPALGLRRAAGARGHSRLQQRSLGDRGRADARWHLRGRAGGVRAALARRYHPRLRALQFGARHRRQRHGIGAALSTAMAGYLAAKFGSGTAFLGLAITAAAAFVTFLVAMPADDHRRAVRQPKQEHRDRRGERGEQLYLQHVLSPLPIVATRRQQPTTAHPRRG